jgi:multidrug efflux pump subunit AcrB
MLGGVHVARFALRNDKVLLFATIVLALLGIRAYLSIPQSIFPAMSFSKVDVVVDAGNLPPSRVRVAIALPLERAFESLANVSRVSASASQGAAELIVDFAPATDPRVDLQAVNEAVTHVRTSLIGAATVTAVVVNPNSEPVLSYALTSATLSQAVLRQIAERSLVPNLFGIGGLGRVLVTGGPTPEYHVDLDPSALASHGLAPADVARALVDANAVLDAGATERYSERHSVVVDASLANAASLAAVGVPAKDGFAATVGSLGTVALGVSPVTDQASFGARAAVVVNAYAVAGADTVKMAAEVRSRIAESLPHLPRDVHVDRFWDQTTLVVESQRSLRDAILLGALLAVIVIYAFLRDVRLTLVAAAIIPIAMAIAVFALQTAGQTLNLMSVGGLAVAVGLIIDDAIVVIEGIARTTADEPALSRREAIERTMATLAGPMAASTATTVVVFVPLGLLTGVTGFFFRALAFTLSTSLVVSLGLALFVAPNVALALFGAAPAHDDEKRARPGGILARYDGVLLLALAHRRIVYVASAVVLAVTVALLAILPTDFLPRMDEGQFEIAYALPSGTTLEATNEASRAMERLVAADPGVASVGRLTGVDSDGYSPTPQNKGLLRVALRPERTRDGYEAIAERLRDGLDALVPSATFDFHQILEDLIDGLSGAPAPVEIALYGPDLQTLDALAASLATRLAKVPGVVDAASGVAYDSPTLRVVPRAARLASLGLTFADVGDAVSASTLGTVATSVAGATAQIPVRVRVTDAAAPAPADATVYGKDGATSLSDVAAVTPQTLVPEENDRNGVRVVKVTANITGATLSAVTANITSLLRAFPLPAGYRAEPGGQSAIAAASFREFVSVIALAIVLVFSVMLATFRSYALPLVILTALPLALIGVALALFVTRTPFNVSSFMGLLLLVGVVVKNGILLIDVANRRRRAGDSVEAALVAAGETRLRPILMTTLAAIGGLLPLAVGGGQGSEMEKPLAIAVIGGLSTATAFTLVVIPVLYAAFAGGSRERTAGA